MWGQATRVQDVQRHQSEWAEYMQALQRLQHQGLSLESAMNGRWQLFPRSAISQQWNLILHLLDASSGCDPTLGSLATTLAKSSRWHLSSHLLQSFLASNIKPGWIRD